MKTLLTTEQIQGRVAEMGATLDERFAGQEVVALIVLRGALFFGTDLLRAMPSVDVRLSTIRVASYAGTGRSGPVRLLHGTRDDLSDRHVIVIEDIVDSGHTLSFLRELIGSMAPRSLTVASLLDKPSRREVRASADLVGFTIEDRFVVGYGLDLDQRYRHLPFLAELDDGDA